MDEKEQKVIIIIIIPIIICFIILLIVFIPSPIEVLRNRDTFILCLNRIYFSTDRYKYKHIIGKHKITSEFGDIFLKTGDKVNDIKRYLGRFYNISDHTINILGNDIINIEYIDIFFYDNFTIKLIQDLNIYSKIFKVEYIFLQNKILTFWIIDFPEEIILKDNTSIKINNKYYNNVEIQIIENKIYLNVKEYYFVINDNKTLYNRLCIDNNWNNIVN
jgi:hypothetical protein